MGDPSDTNQGSEGALAQTPLHALHAELGARFVPFAGYAMPVQYPAGILAEHRQTRMAAGLFDVSHMGQAFLEAADHEAVARALERAVPGEIRALKPGRLRYSVLLNDAGGVIDDLMITRLGGAEGRLLLVVNASRKAVDYEALGERLAGAARLEPAPQLALLALQGPAAAGVMARICPEAAALAFMSARPARIGGQDVHVSRSGYSGEDGFEISVPADGADALARLLLDQSEVEPVGLGARDSLRLEAGLCLYGQDLDETVSPVEADIAFTIAKRRREAADFPGAERILAELASGPARLRTGFLLEGRAPARAGAEIETPEGESAGVLTSGGFSPTLERPIAMGFVNRAAGPVEPGRTFALKVRGRALPATAAQMPFVPHRYHRAAPSPKPKQSG